MRRRSWTHPWAWKLPERSPEVRVDDIAVRLDEAILDNEQDGEDSSGLQVRQSRALRGGILEMSPGEPAQDGGDSTSSNIHSERVWRLDAFLNRRTQGWRTLPHYHQEGTGVRAPFIYSPTPCTSLLRGPSVLPSRPFPWKTLSSSSAGSGASFDVRTPPGSPSV